MLVCFKDVDDWVTPQLVLMVLKTALCCHKEGNIIYVMFNTRSAAVFAYNIYNNHVLKFLQGKTYILNFKMPSKEKIIYYKSMMFYSKQEIPTISLIARSDIVLPHSEWCDLFLNAANIYINGHNALLIFHTKIEAFVCMKNNRMVHKTINNKKVLINCSFMEDKSIIPELEKTRALIERQDILNENIVSWLDL